MDKVWKGKILGIDFGKRRIGLAKSDPSGTIASPLITIKNRGDRRNIENLRGIICKNDILSLLIGVPLDENGQETKMSKLIRTFGERLSRESHLPVIYVNERYSSKEAEEHIIENLGITNRKKIKELVDKMAACMLLQEYVDKDRVKKVETPPAPPPPPTEMTQQAEQQEGEVGLTAEGAEQPVAEGMEGAEQPLPEAPEVVPVNPDYSPMGQIPPVQPYQVPPPPQQYQAPPMFPMPPPVGAMPQQYPQYPQYQYQQYPTPQQPYPFPMPPPPQAYMQPQPPQPQPQPQVHVQPAPQPTAAPDPPPVMEAPQHTEPAPQVIEATGQQTANEEGGNNHG
jgi:putative Holliday junction resolvase